MTTIAAVYAAVGAVSLTGIKRTYGYEPDIVDAADLPAQYVRLPQSDAGRLSDWASACVDMSKERQAQLVVLIEAAGLEQTAANLATMLTFMDRVDAALDALTVGVWRNHVIRPGVVSKNDTDYWAVLADVVVRG